MAFFSQAFVMVIAFAMIMLILSLVIMFLIRAIHYLGNVRAATLGEMLGSLNLGFRLMQGDTAEAGDPGWSAFVSDVLTFPSLHPGKNLLPAPEKNVRKMGKKPGIEPSTASTTVQAGGTIKRTKRARSPRTDVASLQARKQKLANSVDFIAKDDLISIVCRLCGRNYIPGQPVPSVSFPARWTQSLPVESRCLPALVTYIDEFFETAEGVSSDEFMSSAKRLTRLFACLIVVLLNLDSIDLAQDLYRGGIDRTNLNQTAAQVLQLTRQQGALDSGAAPPVRDKLLDDLAPSLTTLTSLLNQPQFQLGWQHSWLAQAWCVAQKQCTSGAVEVPTSRLGWFCRIAEWLTGLALSCIFLSMGAPFWAKRLEEVLDFQSAVEQIKGDSTDSNGAAPRSGVVRAVAVSPAPAAAIGPAEGIPRA
jgi:hypothetical protein